MTPRRTTHSTRHPIRSARPALGAIDRVEQLDGRLRIHGWVGPFGPVSIERLEVRVAGRPAPVLSVLRSESPDIAASYPQLTHADHCRFGVEVDVADRVAELEGETDTLLQLTPWLSSGEPAFDVLGVLRPSIDEPAIDDQEPLRSGFLINGLEFLGHFVHLGGLEPHHRVLDVGCGIGRMAYPLALYLDPGARLRGFDIIESRIRWANEHIAPRHADFAFERVDVKNDLYNPRGQLDPVRFRFPYDDDAFDFAFLTSVFTHMQAAEVRHYLDECARVLRAGGTALLTCFLLNDESRRLIDAGRSTKVLTVPLEDCFTAETEIAELLIGYREELLRQWIDERGFDVHSKWLGGWCGRNSWLTHQDILVLRRR